jgi:hypothetical protein
MLINKKTYKIVAIITLCICNALHWGVEPDGAPVNDNIKVNESDSNIGNPQNLKSSLKSRMVSTSKTLNSRFPDTIVGDLKINKKVIECSPPAPRLCPSKGPSLPDDIPDCLLPPAMFGSESDFSDIEAKFKGQDGLQSGFSPQLLAALQKATAQQNIQ